MEHLGEDLFTWMTGLRRIPLVGLRPVLPIPGRVAGLVGPPPAVVSALDAGQALVVTAGGIAVSTLVPATDTIGSPGGEGHVVRWTEFPAPVGAPMPPPLAPGAREAFLAALREAARSTAELDLVPEEPVPLAQLPAGWTAIVPPSGMDGPARHLLVLAARTLLLTEAELDTADPLASVGSGPPSRAGQSARGAILRSLHEAARDAVVDGVARALTT